MLNRSLHILDSIRWDRQRLIFALPSSRQSDEGEATAIIDRAGVQGRYKTEVEGSVVDGIRGRVSLDTKWLDRVATS